ncbi:MAG: peptidase domain-containing ABC transporter [Alphaproteobacteria bacterium]
MSSDTSWSAQSERAEAPTLRVVSSDSASATEGGAPQGTAASAAPVDGLLRCLLRTTLAFDRPVSEADIRAFTPIGPDGMTVETFLRAADRLGYKVGRTALDAATAAQLPTPFITLGSGGVAPRVVLARESGRLSVFDSVTGATAEIGASEVAEGYHEALLIQPRSEITAPVNWRSLIKTRVRKVVWELVLSSFVVNMFALASPLFVMTVYNKVVGQRSLDTLDVLVIGMATLYFFDFILRGIRGYVSSHTGARLDALLGNEVIHRLLHLPFRHFESTPTGLISERLRQLDTIRAFFTGQMPVVLVDVCFMFLFVGTLLFISPMLGVITIAAIPIFLLISVAFHRLQKGLAEKNFAALAAKTSTLTETVTNALTIKSLGLESEMEKRWGGRLAMTAHTGFEANNLANIVGVLGNVLQQAVSLMIIFVGARAIIGGDMSIGALIAANILSSRALGPIRQVVAALHQLQEVRAAFRRIDEVMNEPIESRPGSASPLPPLKGDIAFENVTYRYAKDLPPAIESLNLSIDSGTIVAFIGPSGSGKSTLGRLIQGLYTPTGGRILIDRTDIAHMSTPWLRNQIGVVPQDVQLFAGTVRDNIAMGLPVKQPERIVAVAKFVGAHDFIQRLPQGYDTVLSERGGGLSAGQRQLLCIARALIRNPRILILDEATSALDAASEAIFIRNLKRASRGRTIILISHRMAPIAIADKVAFIMNGHIERMGTPNEVIEFAKERMAEQMSASQT